MKICYFTTTGNCLHVAERDHGPFPQCACVLARHHQSQRISRLQPIIYDEERRAYSGLGETVADAFKPGIELKNALNT